jgi:hypothetical protein
MLNAASSVGTGPLIGWWSDRHPLAVTVQRRRYLRGRLRFPRTIITVMAAITGGNATETE